MEQLVLFAEAGQSKGLPKEYLEFFPKLIDPFTGQQLLEKFIEGTLRKLQVRMMYIGQLLSCHGDHLV